MNVKGEDFLKKDNIVTKKTNICYNKDGVMINDSCTSEEICCQYIKYDGREVYYALQDSLRKLYNPKEVVANQRKNISYKMKTVSEMCFLKYMDFLITKNDIDFNKANRLCSK